MKIISAPHSIIKWIINHGKEQNREEEEEEPEFIFTAYKEWRWRFFPHTQEASDVAQIHNIQSVDTSNRFNLVVLVILVPDINKIQHVIFNG